MPDYFIPRPHKWREWGGPKFGTQSTIFWNGKSDPIEPFPGACGDCSKAKEEHIPNMTHKQQIELLREIQRQAEENTKRIKELTEWFITEIGRTKNDLA